MRRSLPLVLAFSVVGALLALLLLPLRDSVLPGWDGLIEFDDVVSGWSHGQVAALVACAGELAGLVLGFAVVATRHAFRTAPAGAVVSPAAAPATSSPLPPADPQSTPPVTTEVAAAEPVPTPLAEAMSTAHPTEEIPVGPPVGQPVATVPAAEKSLREVLDLDLPVLDKVVRGDAATGYAEVWRAIGAVAGPSRVILCLATDPSGSGELAAGLAAAAAAARSKVAVLSARGAEAGTAALGQHLVGVRVREMLRDVEAVIIDGPSLGEALAKVLLPSAEVVLVESPGPISRDVLAAAVQGLVEPPRRFGRKVRSVGLVLIRD